jgi:hypothetical protein
VIAPLLGLGITPGLAQLSSSDVTLGPLVVGGVGTGLADGSEFRN